MPGRHARRGVDRHRVRGAPRVLAVRHHQRQVERVGPRRRHRRAQVARRVPDGPRDPLGGRRLRGEDDVGLVLAVGRVGDEHRTALRAAPPAPPRRCRAARPRGPSSQHPRRREQPFGVLGQHVDLQVDPGTGRERAEGRRLERGGDERDAERLVGDVGDRQRDAGDRDRPLLGDVPRELRARARSRRRPSAVRATGSGSCRRRRRAPGRRARRTGRRRAARARG